MVPAFRLIIKKTKIYCDKIIMVIEESISAENTKTKNKKYTGYSEENGIERLGRSRGCTRRRDA